MEPFQRIENKNSVVPMRKISNNENENLYQIDFNLVRS